MLYLKLLERTVMEGPTPFWWAAVSLEVGGSLYLKSCVLYCYIISNISILFLISAVTRRAELGFVAASVNVVECILGGC
jgi:hypothetical protein